MTTASTRSSILAIDSLPDAFAGIRVAATSWESVPGDSSTLGREPDASSTLANELFGPTEAESEDEEMRAFAQLARKARHRASKENPF